MEFMMGGRKYVETYNFILANEEQQTQRLDRVFVPLVLESEEYSHWLKKITKRAWKKAIIA